MPEHYDAVVVGTGSAGCVVATRLSARGSRSVLLLEAGPDLRADPPALMHDGWRTYRENGWGFESEPDEHGVREPLYRGKVVGGTSWVTRFAMRGSPADFNLWARLGNDGWGFDDVLPYFIRIENDLDFGDRAWHGNAGPLPVTRYPELEPSEYESAAVAALAGTGFAPVEDHNRPGALGFGRMPRNGRGGERVTGADTHGPVGGASQGVHLRDHAEVAEVVLEGRRAVGVRLLNGATIAADWVVLSAGTYGSPAILLRSGIGPPDHLRAVDIPVRVELPGVGSNLADHPGFAIDPGLRGAPGAAPRFFTLATWHSSLAASSDAPDLALWVYDPIGASGAPSETSVVALLLTPRSRGSVRLRSADPTQPPRIELPGLRENADVERLAEGAARAVEVANHSAVRRLCANPPTPSVGKSKDLRDVITETVESFPHVVGTCAMGRQPDDGAVVDNSGCVHGTECLSVVDASIFPTPPSGFPHIITIMMAERIAELLSPLL